MPIRDCQKGRALRCVPNNDRLGRGLAEDEDMKRQSAPRASAAKRGGPATLPRWRSVLRQLVADNPAALHHELDALKLGDVRQRLAGNRDEIGIFAFLDRPDLILPPQRLGVDDGGGLDCTRRTHVCLLDERLDFERLRSMREGRAVDPLPTMILRPLVLPAMVTAFSK